MSYVGIQLPWLIWTLFGCLALYGAVALGMKLAELIRLVIVLRGGSLDPTLLQEKIFSHYSEADQEAQTLLDRKVRTVWRSLTPVQWLDINILRDECIVLVKQIAKVYYPSSTRPEMEVTVLELLRLCEKVSHEISALLRPFPILHKVSVSTIMDTKAIYEQTRNVIEKKGIRSGALMANQAYRVLNALNPQYWINRLLFKGASEMVGRKVLTSIFRIVGSEAMRVYRTSAAIRVDPAVLLQIKREATEQAVFEKAASRVISEPDPIPLPTIEAEPVTIEMLPSHELQEYVPVEEEAAMRVEDLGPMAEEAAGTKQPFRERMYVSLAETLSKFVEGSLNMWDKVVSREKVFASYQKQGMSVERLQDIHRLPIVRVDAMADHYLRWGVWMTAAEGAATGMGGLFMLAADAVSLLALQLRIIQQIGYCYGFDVSRSEEKLFAAKLLSEAYLHPAKQERTTVIEEMRNAARLLKGDQPLGMLRNRFFVYGFKKVVEKIGIRLGGRKTAQLVPVIGAVAGGYINKRVTQDIAEVAKEVYRDRMLRIQEEQGYDDPVRYGSSDGVV